MLSWNDLFLRCVVPNCSSCQKPRLITIVVLLSATASAEIFVILFFWQMWVIEAGWKKECKRVFHRNVVQWWFDGSFLPDWKKTHLMILWLQNPVLKEDTVGFFQCGFSWRFTIYVFVWGQCIPLIWWRFFSFEESFHPATFHLVSVFPREFFTFLSRSIHFFQDLILIR